MTQNTVETPVEPGPRTGVVDTKEQAPMRGPLVQMFERAIVAAEKGEITRGEVDPVIPRPVVLEPYQAPYVPREYRAASLDRFDASISGPSYERELSFASRAVVKWAHAAQTGRRAMLALVGSQGNGKSTLLYGAVNRLAGHQVRVFSRPWYRLADELRYGGPVPWAPDSAPVEAHELRRAMYRSPVVVIDEVRSTAGTSFDDTELAKFACHAWDEGIAVLITTNVNPLSLVMGDAAADRFTIVTLTAPSRRQA